MFIHLKVLILLLIYLLILDLITMLQKQQHHFFLTIQKMIAVKLGHKYDTSDDLANGTGFQKLNVSSTWGTPSNDQGLSGQLHLFDPSNTTFVKHFLARTNLTVAYSLDSQYVNGYANTTSAVDAVQFKFESGNIDSGIIKMYGIK